jgi:polyribonucleotide nucleotidyltransferase
MIAEGWTHDTQVLSWVLSYDGKHQPSPLAVCGASAALLLSDVPLTKPVAAVELGLDRATGSFIVNPTKAEQADSPLLMTLAGTAEGVLMIEGAADFLTEVCGDAL